MTNFFNKFKKTLFLAHFWSIFQILGAKKSFPENPTLPCTTPYGFLAPSKNLEKTIDTTAIKCPRRQKNKRRGMDRPYFIGTFWWSKKGTKPSKFSIPLCTAKLNKSPQADKKP